MFRSLTVLLILTEISLFDDNFDSSFDVSLFMLADPYFSISTRAQHISDFVVVFYFAAIFKMIIEEIGLFKDHS
jgi:hypothetical protein